MTLKPFEIIKTKDKPMRWEKPEDSNSRSNDGLWIEGRRCRSCGCIDEDCSKCIERTGERCWWVKDDLCSACE